MSERAHCPNCGGYASECFYEHRHRWCGWNCHVEHQVSVHGANGEIELRHLHAQPTEVQCAALAVQFTDACAALGLGSGEPHVSVLTLVDGTPAEDGSPHFGPLLRTPATPSLARACLRCAAPAGHSCRDLRPECAGRMLKKPHSDR
jgi:hypothetical protein